MIINKVIKYAKSMGIDPDELMQMTLIDVLVEIDERKDTWNKWEKEMINRGD